MSLNESAQKKPLEQMSEVELYLLINTASYIQWRMNHDAADGRIPNEGIDESIKNLYQIQKNAMKQLKRFDITPFTKNGKTSSDAYKQWFHKWDKYVKNLSQDDYDKLEEQINNGDASCIKAG
jgi:CO dehydrogenase/acetyl-CoA synthase beta subunit